MRSVPRLIARGSRRHGALDAAGCPRTKQRDSSPADGSRLDLHAVDRHSAARGTTTYFWSIPEQTHRPTTESPITPAASIDYTGKLTRFSSGYSGSFVRYMTLNELNSLQQSLRASVDRRVSDRLTLIGQESYTAAPTTDVLQLSGVPFYRIGSRSNAATGGAQSSLGQTHDAAKQLHAAHESTSIRICCTDNQLQGGHAHDIITTVEQALSRHFTVGGEYEFSRAIVNGQTDPRAAPTPEDRFNMQTAMATAQYQVAAGTTISGGFGVAMLGAGLTHEARTGPEWRAGFSQKTGRGVVSASYEPVLYSLVRIRRNVPEPGVDRQRSHAARTHSRIRRRRLHLAQQRSAGHQSAQPPHRVADRRPSATTWRAGCRSKDSTDARSRTRSAPVDSWSGTRSGSGRRGQAHEDSLSRPTYAARQRRHSCLQLRPTTSAGRFDPFSPRRSMTSKSSSSTTARTTVRRSSRRSRNSPIGFTMCGRRTVDQPKRATPASPARPANSSPSSMPTTSGHRRSWRCQVQYFQEHPETGLLHSAVVDGTRDGAVPGPPRHGVLRAVPHGLLHQHADRHAAAPSLQRSRRVRRAS